MSVNHVNEFEKRVNQFIDKTLQSITKGANNIPREVSKENVKRRKEFAKAQIEALHVVKKQLPSIKERIEYMR